MTKQQRSFRQKKHLKAKMQNASLSKHEPLNHKIHIDHDELELRNQFIRPLTEEEASGILGCFHNIIKMSVSTCLRYFTSRPEVRCIINYE